MGILPEEMIGLTAPLEYNTRGAVLFYSLRVQKIIIFKTQAAPFLGALLFMGRMS
jgi:hypothetical protein